MLLLVTIVRCLIHLGIALAGLAAMVIFVQHQPDSQAGMVYIHFYAVPMMALCCAVVSGVAINDYLHPESE